MPIQVGQTMTITNFLDGTSDTCGLVQARYGLMLHWRFDRYIGRSLGHYGEWCEGEMTLMGSACRPGDVVVDAGANVGSHALAFARAVGPEGQVHAFEPQLETASLLGANAAINGLRQIHMHPLALAEHEQTLSVRPLFYDRSEQNVGGVSLQTDGLGRATRAEALDRYLDPPSLRLIKADVEGMELSVVNGAAGLIHQFHPLLYLENDRVERSKALIEGVQALNYRLYWHRVMLFNPNNFAGNSENLFPGVVSTNMVAAHESDHLTGPELIPVHPDEHPSLPDWPGRHKPIE
ncbi:MAG: FkbM family methyltransferase [Pseudomonadota bacterium]